MTQNPQVPWTDEQWARVTQVINEEARRARVAATFLPHFGPLPPNVDFVPRDRMNYHLPEHTGDGRDNGTSVLPRNLLWVDDITTIPLTTLQVKVFLRAAQMADPDMSSALQMFRRAANVLARLEDTLVFNGQPGPGRIRFPEGTSASIPPIWEALRGHQCRGLLHGEHDSEHGDSPTIRVPMPGEGLGLGEELVGSISSAISALEGNGHFGPFAVVLGHKFFTAVQTPSPSLVLPQDRIVPFLGGGPLLRSSTIPDHSGIVVAVGSAPVELVVATDMSLGFMQVTTDPAFAFRVYEKIVLRIKEPSAITALRPYGA